MASTKDELWAGLEEVGESEVRIRLQNGVYGTDGLKRSRVVEWLRLAAERRNAASMSEQIRIARSAKNAAWMAATAAIIAAICAAAAIVISLSFSGPGPSS